MPKAPLANDRIIVVGARENNLKNVTVEIPRDRLVVITGLSGSGKSSLAFDTIYAEGQRRYVESLSSYARQFLGQLDKPDVDHIEGLSPAVSIDQKSASRNPRSTVGTVTEIYDYLRILFARVGTPFCVNGHGPIERQSTDQIVEVASDLPEGTRVQVLAPIVRGRKGTFKKELEDIAKAGYVRVRVDGVMHEVTDDIEIDRYKNHTIEVVVDRLVTKAGIERRLSDSLESALKMSGGMVSLALGFKEGAEIPMRIRALAEQQGVLEASHRRHARDNPTNSLPPSSRLIDGTSKAREGRPGVRCSLFGVVLVRGVRVLAAGARAAAVLVQLAVRGVPGVYGARDEDGVRSVAHRAGPSQKSLQRRGDSAVHVQVGGREGLVAGDARRGG